ncbi:hypothetical protein SAY87_011942 [Trapa incisa]|uniref:Sialate O-acetylesterase domain-containing protein n=1 Tax=Trapa incisa TaxID=236973 RepID=A0AAN7JJD4_9MYRT|nr:hypothetical protein SAY87_011942 [Trapa incisa]
MLRVLFLVFLLASAQSGSLQKEAPPAPHNIFILAGQSNMSGRGGVELNATTGFLYWDGILPPECQPNASIFRLDADLKWVQATEPLHDGIDTTLINGVGPGMPFAHEILHLKPDYGTIGLVPCALSGSSIKRWQRGSPLYDRLMRRVNAAVESGGKVRGMLWYQGGADSMAYENAIAYERLLTQFFRDVTEELNSPGFMILQAAVASAKEKFTSIVRAAQFNVKEPNLLTVDADRLPVEWDNLHLNTRGQIQLGNLLASTYLKTSTLVVK